MNNALILITGGTGAIGKKLIKELKNYGYRLRILIRNANDEKLDGIEFAAGDLNNIESLEKAAAGVDAVIHLAGITHTNNLGLYYKINTEGTKNLTKACRINNVKRFIYISSRAACPEGGAYAESKLLAENFLKESSLDWTILRPSEVYGADKKAAISKLVNIIQKYPYVPVVGDGQYLLSPVYADDLIQSIIAALKNNISLERTYTIAGPETLTYSDLIDRISKILGVKRIKIFLPLGLFKLLAFLFYILKINILVQDQIPRLLCVKSSDVSLARKDLNFNPRTIEEGIKIMNANKK